MIQPLRDKHWQKARRKRRKSTKASETQNQLSACLKVAYARIDALERRVAKIEKGSVVIAPELGYECDLDIDTLTGRFKRSEP